MSGPQEPHALTPAELERQLLRSGEEANGSRNLTQNDERYLRGLATVYDNLVSGGIRGQSLATMKGQFANAATGLRESTDSGMSLSQQNLDSMDRSVRIQLDQNYANPWVP